MRSRRVLVLRFGVWGLGVDAESVQSVRKRSACVRKRPQCVRKRPRKRPPCVRKRPRPKVVAKRRTVVAFGFALGLRVSKVSTVSGIGEVVGSWSQNAEQSSLLDARLVFASQKCQRSSGIGGVVGSWPRNAELSSLLDSRLVFASQKCQRSQRSGGSSGRGRETQNCLLDLRCVFASQQCHKSQGSGGCRVVVAKRRTVVTFGLAFGLRATTVSGLGGVVGSWSRTQNCRHCWTRVWSSRLKSVNSLKDPGGSWSRSAEVLSLNPTP